MLMTQVKKNNKAANFEIWLSVSELIQLVAGLNAFFKKGKRKNNSLNAIDMKGLL